MVDAQAFEQIVTAYYEPLYRFAFSLCQREAEAGDLTQETFFRWASKGHQLRDQTKVKSWLFTTLYRQFIGQQRRDSRFPHVEVDANSHELPAVFPRMEREIDGTAALEALGEVDEIYRAPLVLLYLDDHSYKEIADTLDIPIGTVMSRLARGKEQLRELMSDRRGKSRPTITPLNAGGRSYPLSSS